MTKNKDKQADFEKKAFRAIYRLSRSIMKATTVQDVFSKILDTAIDVIGVEKASIMRYDDKEGVLKIIAARGIPKDVLGQVAVKPGEGISGKVFKTARPILIKDVAARKEALRHRRYKSTSLISAPVTCFPVSVRGKAVGVINMTDKIDGSVFTPHDLELVTVIAAEAAAYIRILNLAEYAKEGERLRRELEMAREIQNTLLPRTLPSLAGVDVAGECIMAENVGGDYFDVLHYGLAPSAFVVADVSGHGIGAALLMGGLRSALRAELGIPALPPSAVIRKLNRLIFDDLVRAEQFISMFYAQYIHSTRTLRYSNAGHPPPMLYRNRNKRFELLDTDGCLLGVEAGEHFYDMKVSVDGGDILVMYTDGITEAVGKRGFRFGMNGIKKSVLSAKNLGARGIVKNILDNLVAHVGGAKLSDDATVLVLKFK